MQDRFVWDQMRRVPFTPITLLSKPPGQALRNIISILNAADAVAEHITDWLGL